MIDSLRNWYQRNAFEITWFLIGWLTLSSLDNLARGRYVWAVIDGSLAYLNFYFRKAC